MKSNFIARTYKKKKTSNVGFHLAYYLLVAHMAPTYDVEILSCWVDAARLGKQWSRPVCY